MRTRPDELTHPPCPPLRRGGAVCSADGDKCHFRVFAAAICSLAAATTLSGVKPNFFCSSFSGAEAPKVCMPIVVPVGPTYRLQPNVAACSTETRAVTDE